MVEADNLTPQPHEDDAQPTAHDPAALDHEWEAAPDTPPEAAAADEPDALMAEPAPHDEEPIAPARPNDRYAPPPADLDDAQAAAEESERQRARLAQRPTATPRTRIPALPVGLLLIALGVILVWPVFSGGYILVPAAIAAIVTVGVALSLIAHWLSSGRRARGALFIALGLLLGGLLTAVFALQPEGADVTRYWPLYIVALGGTLLLTFLGDRRRDRRFMLPGVILAVGGLVALAGTLGQLPPDLFDLVEQFWPWVLVVLALGMLPLAIRRVPE